MREKQYSGIPDRRREHWIEVFLEASFSRRTSRPWSRTEQRSGCSVRTRTVGCSSVEMQIHRLRESWSGIEIATRCRTDEPCARRSYPERSSKTM